MDTNRSNSGRNRRRPTLDTVIDLALGVLLLMLIALGPMLGNADGATVHSPYVRCEHLPTRATITCVFGPYGQQAVRVARCESTLRTTARNGQYLGLFQMGYHERLRYGHGSTALAQARAAYRYFVASGRDWSPWACRWAARAR